MKAITWLRDQEREDQDKLTELILRICRDDIPQECSEEWFDAMFCVAMGNFEHIEFESLVGLRASDLIAEEAGLLLPSLEHSPSFSFPRSRKAYPCTGFIPTEWLTGFPYRPGGKVSDKQLAELDSEVDELLKEFGISETVPSRYSKKKSPPSRIEGVKEELDFLFETLQKDSFELFIMFF
jgi:hypothetical protein